MKPIRTAVIYLAAGLLGGFALSALLSDNPELATEAPLGDTAAFERRIALLEAQVDAVVSNGVMLSTEIERLEALLAAQPESAGLAAADTSPALRGADEPAGDAAESAEARAQMRERFLQARRSRELDLVEQLTAGGFSSAEAQQIETRIEELRVAAMQSRYEALRSGEPADGALNGLDTGTGALRAELGDEQYERFLQATGRPTRVGVSGVLASSAAETAGMLSGDEILAYGGERVFDIRDLNRVLLDGEPGEPVIVDIVRDGQPMQVVMPRGPLGISSGFPRGGARR